MQLDDEALLSCKDFVAVKRMLNSAGGVKSAEGITFTAGTIKEMFSCIINPKHIDFCNFQLIPVEKNLRAVIKKLALIKIFTLCKTHPYMTKAKLMQALSLVEHMQLEDGSFYYFSEYLDQETSQNDPSILPRENGFMEAVIAFDLREADERKLARCNDDIDSICRLLQTSSLLSTKEIGKLLKDENIKEIYNNIIDPTHTNYCKPDTIPHEKLKLKILNIVLPLFLQQVCKPELVIISKTFMDCLYRVSNNGNMLGYNKSYILNTIQRLLVLGEGTDADIPEQYGLRKAVTEVSKKLNPTVSIVNGPNKERKELAPQFDPSRRGLKRTTSFRFPDPKKYRLEMMSFLKFSTGEEPADMDSNNNASTSFSRNG